MEAEFERRFGRSPQFEVKCPGRVNLIGEHIDYMGYGVLPMAIEVRTRVLAAISDQPVIVLQNVDEKYKERREALPSDWQGQNQPDWSDYVMAGWRAAIDHLQKPAVGFVALFDGTIPAAAGLSSSSSIVCASALTTLAVQSGGKPWETIQDKRELAEICTTSERRIGTAGGGMDQASECLSPDGAALRIDFHPLRVQPVHLPEEAVFVVADSGLRKNKAASNEYNTRVVECRVAVQLLAKRLNLENGESLRRLGEVQEASGLDFPQLLKHVEELPETLTQEEAASMLGGEEKLKALFTHDTSNVTSFFIRSRARHVFSEAERVFLFASACASNDVTELGRLMDASHSSCSADYDCSAPKLDQLVADLKKAGALGARLTGAGWGGCAVALFSAAHLDAAGDAALAHLPILFRSKPSAGITFNSL